MFHTTATEETKQKTKYLALEMDEFVTLHQIPNQKSIAFSALVVIGDANLTSALLPNSTDYIVLLLFTV